MKILLVTRGSQGDVLPYLAVAEELRRRGHWKVMNRFTNLMVKETINKQRQRLGMTPIQNFGYHAESHSLNYLMYSPQLGETDPDWPFHWEIGGYCFNDNFSYEESAYQTMLRFVESGSDPILFFTLGSCSAKEGHLFCQMLLESCRKMGFRLLIGSGWSQTGIQLKTNDRLFLLTQPLPHHLLLSHCQGVIHHGGCGTTHSIARAGKPQLLTPLLLDQPYWAYRVERLGIGSRALRIGKANQQTVDRKVEELMTSSRLKQQAEQLGQLIRAERGVRHFCDYIEQTKGAYFSTK